MKRISIVLICLICLTGCFDDKLSNVKESKLSICSNKTIEEIINMNVKDIKWESDVDKQIYTLKGNIDYENTKTNIELTFKYEDSTELKSFKINDEEATKLIYSSILDDMCNVTNNKVMDNTEYNNIIKESLEEAAKEWYQTKYQPSMGKGVKVYEDNGLKVKLSDLENNGYIKLNSLIKSKIDLDSSRAVIYPKVPYGPTAFVIDSNITFK